MDHDFKLRGIPAFGNWDYDYEDGFPITQYFESARQVTLLHSSSKDGDLYGESYIYTQEVNKPVFNEVSCTKNGWIYDLPRISTHKAPKAVDEDLYQIPHEQFLYNVHKNKKRKKLDFFSRCLQPTCHD